MRQLLFRPFAWKKLSCLADLTKARCNIRQHRPPSCYAPFLANQGALFVNAQVMEEKGLDMPASAADLADPQYEGNISMIDIAGSSTAWLMVQSLVASYGEEEAEQILTDIYRNAGVHMEQSGSGPIKKVRAAEVARLLAEDPAITHVSIVHSETTSGILNDIASVARVVKAAGKTYIVDTVSSFGGVDIDLPALGIDFLISSANKCIQGVPGFSFILARRSALLACKDRARSLSLDLYDQWETMEKDGKWRYTSPTHVVLAFAKALEEFAAEGGVPARGARYAANRDLLIERMTALGFATYIPAEHQGPIIVTFFYPEGETIDFKSMYDYIKARGYAIYPGKLTDADTFRIGVIGEIYPADIEAVTGIFADYLAAHRRGEVR